MLTNIIITFFCSVFLSLILILIFKNLFYKINILDNPKKYGKKRDPIPYSMGIVIFFSFLILSFFTIKHNNPALTEKYYLILIFGGLITLVSFIDDMLNVSPKIRLIIQIIIGIIIGITSIKVDYISNIFGGIIDLKTYFFTVFSIQIYIVPLIFTIVWYVFVFNAINWTDGIQGNTSGLSIISFFIILLLGVKLFFSDNYGGSKENGEFIISITSTLVGILIPFWYFDIKEKILMGDSGTMFLGFMLATIAIISGGKIATVLVVFGIYSVDAIYVLVKRIYNGKNPLKGDFTHLHHRLIDVGLSNKQVLFLVYSLSFFFGLTALFLDKLGKIIVFLIIIIVVVFINKILETVKILKLNNISKKNKKGFTLIEIIVVISVISIISVFGINSFYSFVNGKDLQDKIYVINRDLDDINNDMKNYKISDYEVHLKPGLGYYYYTNYFDNNQKQTLDIDFSNGNGTINFVSQDFIYLKIYSQNFSKSYNILKNGTFTGTFLDHFDYKIIGISSGKTLNDINIKYFGEENIGTNKNENNLLKLEGINTNENKTGTNIPELIIKNTGKGRELYKEDGITKINEAYLFFSKQGKEEKMKIE